MKRRNFEDIFERSNLTNIQLLMWVEESLYPEKPIYRQTATLTIPAEIDPEHFQRAFQTLLNSSDALRSFIEERDGLPNLRVRDPYTYSMETLDLSRATDGRIQLENWVRQRSQAKFDMTGPLIDSALAKLAANEFVWFFAYHHIILDGWSVHFALRRMSELYERSVAGDLPDHVALPAFGDYLEYHQEYRRSPRYEEAKNYWQNKLELEISPLNFYGHGTSSLQPGSGIRVPFELGRARTQQLKAIATSEAVFTKSLDVSLFNILGALLYAYVHLVSGNRTLSIGAAFHNRRTRAFRETIGMFVEVHPLRLTIAGDETFLSLIRKLAAETVETLRHSESPPYFVNGNTYDVLLNFYGSSDLRFCGVPVGIKRPITPGNKALALAVPNNLDDNFVLMLDLRSDVFDEERRGRAVEHFLQILDSFLEKPVQRLGQCDLLSQRDRQRVLVEFNQTVPVASNCTLSQQFDARAGETPDSVAVIFEGHSLTYGYLRAEANRLAHVLRRLGVGPQVRVGILLERSVELVVGILGVIKAGGAYVPLDPAYPRERVAFMLSDSGAAVVLTQSALKDRLPSPQAESPQTQVVFLDEDRHTIGSESAHDPTDAASPEHLAYVIYTSGSTGRPKGVLVNHRNVIRMFGAAQSSMEIGSTDVWTLFHTCAFDMAVWELWGALLHGGQVVVIPFETTRSPGSFLDVLIEQQVTVMSQTPSAFYPFMQLEAAIGYGKLALRLVFLGGEALDVQSLDPWFARHGYSRPRVFNAYGPTETTIFATFACLTPGSVIDGPGSLIGKRLADLELYLLGPGLDPVGIGMIGEIHVGGPGVSLGYLNRPELTGERFVPDAFADRAGMRVYRTGDVARYRSDGSLEFLGRMDHQVKIRGYRIEAGEVEFALTQHPQVREAVVVAREEKSETSRDGHSGTTGPAHAASEKRLVAYLTIHGGVMPHVGELRSFLGERLPEYMVPAVFLRVDSFPLSASGKVDRQALLELEGSEVEREEAYAVPETPAEHRVAGIWAKVLRVERVGRHDDFLALGGNSLLATQVASRIQSVFQVALSPKTIFEQRTVAGLVNAIETIQWALQESRSSSRGRTDRRVV